MICDKFEILIENESDEPRPITLKPIRVPFQIIPKRRIQKVNEEMRNYIENISSGVSKEGIDKATEIYEIQKRRLQKVTNIEKEAWKVSNTLSKTIEYLYKNELSETTRRKMVRDMLKERFLKFYEQQSCTKEVQQSSATPSGYPVDNPGT